MDHPITMDRERGNLQHHLQQSNMTLLEVSLKLGKNATYLQQYLKRGSPRVLPEDVRYSLAQILGCDESEFNPYLLAGLSDSATPYIAEKKVKNGHDQARQKHDPAIVTLDYIDDSMVASNRIMTATFPMLQSYLLSLTRTSSHDLLMVKFRDDSMAPTIGSGELVLLDSTVSPLLRDGIFAFKTAAGGLILRRSQRDFIHDRIRLTCDNPLFRHTEELTAEQISTAGLVIWVAGLVQ